MLEKARRQERGLAAVATCPGGTLLTPLEPESSCPRERGGNRNRFCYKRPAREGLPLAARRLSLFRDGRPRRVARHHTFDPGPFYPRRASEDAFRRHQASPEGFALSAGRNGKSRRTNRPPYEKPRERMEIRTPPSGLVFLAKNSATPGDEAPEGAVVAPKLEPLRLTDRTSKDFTSGSSEIRCFNASAYPRSMAFLLTNFQVRN